MPRRALFAFALAVATLFALSTVSAQLGNPIYLPLVVTTGGTFAPVPTATTTTPAAPTATTTATTAAAPTATTTTPADPTATTQPTATGTSVPAPTATGTTAPAPTATTNPYYTAGQDLYNCTDFATWAQANAAYQANLPGAPNRLDNDGAGIPCEGLPGAP